MINKYREHNCTYEEWLELDCDETYELIDGQLYLMSYPNNIHQAALSSLSFLFSDYFRQRKTCRLFVAGFGFRPIEGEDTGLIPDLTVICGLNKLRGVKRGMDGVPNLVVEVLSPSTSRHDKFTKYGIYQRAGIAEYWMVDTVKMAITVNHLENGHYTSKIYCSGQTAESAEFPGLTADLSEVFLDAELFGGEA